MRLYRWKKRRSATLRIKLNKECDKLLKGLNSRRIGAIVLVISILMGVSLVFIAKSTQESERIACESACGGSCESEGCPMNQSPYEEFAYYFSSSFVIVGTISGLYLAVSKPEKLVLGEETKFDVILSILNEDEREVMKAIKEQEGIKQSTLKYRVEYSKAKLSNLLKDLEKRGLLTRKEEGKTYRVFLKRSM